LFRLRNNQVVTYTPGVEHDARTERTPWCPGFQGCEEPRLVTVSDLDLTNVIGSLVRTDTLDPDFALTLSANIPAAGAYVAFTCGGQPVPTQPIIHGAPAQETRTVTIHYADLKTYAEFNPVPGADEEMEVVLRPVDCNGVAAPGPSSCH
jgi:hypothetical protein